MKKLSLKLFALGFCFFMANQNPSDAFITRLEDGSFQITGGEDDEIFNAMITKQTQVEYEDHQDNHKYTISIQVEPKDIDLLVASQSNNDIIAVENEIIELENLAKSYVYTVVTTTYGEIKFALTYRQIKKIN